MQAYIVELYNPKGQVSCIAMRGKNPESIKEEIMEYYKDYQLIRIIDAAEVARN